MSAVSLLLLVPLAGLAGAPGEGRPARQSGPAPTPDGIGDEPLRNDAFLPLAVESVRGLAAGDEALERARALADAGLAEDARRELASALDAWAGAAATGEAGWVVVDGERAEPRWAVDPAVALARRLASLETAERSLWRERFGPLADASLAEARGPEGLARTERLYPTTRGAALAALRLADLELEAGRVREARAWLARARAHARGDSGVPPAFGPGLESRLRRCGELLARSAPDPAGSWEGATSLAPLGRVRIASSRRGLRPRPGLCFLDGGRICVQTEERIEILEVGPDRLVRQLAFDPDALLREPLGSAPGPARAERDPPGWPLLPLSSGGDLFLVVGRTVGDSPNALVCLRPPSPAPRPGEPAFPVLRWALSGNWLTDGTRLEVLDAWSALESGEIQPGPVVVGERVVFQVRVSGSEVQPYAVAVDRRTGRPAWMRLLGSGSDLTPDRGRFIEAGAAPPRLAAQPTAARGERVLFGTNLGLAFLLDALDGRGQFAFRYRRRAPTDEGFAGGRPLAPTGEESPATLLLAPFDSDRVYRLSTDPGLSTLPDPSALREAPRALPEARALVGGSADELVVLGRAGAENAVTTWSADRSRREDAFYLGPAEEFAGAGVLGARRALVTSDRGLYLLDRERDLYVLDFEPLVPVDARGDGGGDVRVHGNLVLVLGDETLWAFRIEG